MKPEIAQLSRGATRPW